MTDFENYMTSTIRNYKEKYGVNPNIIVISKDDENDIFYDQSSTFFGLVPRKKDFEQCKIIAIDEYRPKPECYEEKDILELLKSKARKVSKKLKKDKDEDPDKFEDLHIAESILVSYEDQYIS